MKVVVIIPFTTGTLSVIHALCYVEFILVFVCFSYDDEADRVTRYQKILLEDLDRMEIGPAPALFKSKHVVLRIHYQHEEDPNYFHSFRTTGTRLFNNMLISIRNEEDSKGESFNSEI